MVSAEIEEDEIEEDGIEEDGIEEDGVEEYIQMALARTVRTT